MGTNKKNSTKQFYSQLNLAQSLRGSKLDILVNERVAKLKQAWTDLLGRASETPDEYNAKNAAIWAEYEKKCDLVWIEYEAEFERLEREHNERKRAK